MKVVEEEQQRGVGCCPFHPLTGTVVERRPSLRRRQARENAELVEAVQSLEGVGQQPERERRLGLNGFTQPHPNWAFGLEQADQAGLAEASFANHEVGRAAALSSIRQTEAQRADDRVAARVGPHSGF